MGGNKKFDWKQSCCHGDCTRVAAGKGESISLLHGEHTGRVGWFAWEQRLPGRPWCCHPVQPRSPLDCSSPRETLEETFPLGMGTRQMLSWGRAGQVH